MGPLSFVGGGLTSVAAPTRLRLTPPEESRVRRLTVRGAMRTVRTMTNVNGIQHQFNPDDLVEALDPHSRAWRLAWIERLDPYLGSPGYRVRYADATEQWHCHSGHQMEATVRGVKFCEARTRTWDGMTQHNRLQHSMRGVPFAAICISCDNCGASRAVLCMKAAEPPVPSEAILRTARDAAEKMIDDGRAMVERGQAALREVAREERKARERASERCDICRAAGQETCPHGGAEAHRRFRDDFFGRRVRA